MAPLQFDEPVEPASPPAESAPDARHATVSALFENDIDFREALRHLRKHGVEPDAISIVVHMPGSDDTERPSGEVVRAVSDLGMSSIADWLVGFATVVVRDHGVFVVAGPMGALIAGERVLDEVDDDDCPLTAMFRRLGYSRDEACYMLSRLDSDSYLAGVTTGDTDAARVAMQTFSQESAVFLASAATNPDVAEQAARLLVSPPEASTDGDVVVTDAVACFVRYIDSGRASERHASLRGKHIVDPDGEDTGEVVDFIAETVGDGSGPDAADEVRYAIIGFGGVLGIGRHLAAVPIDKFQLDSDPIRVLISRDALRRAPQFDDGAPFSRREELAVCDYFGSTPYWSDRSAPAPQPETQPA